MNQTPAALLILAASILGYGAQSAALTSSNQSPIALTLAAVAVGVWGVISLLTACVREREMLIDSQARLDVLDHVLIREPIQALKNMTNTARPQPRREARRPLEIPADLQTQLNAIADLEGRDRSVILEEALRRHLPKLQPNRAA